MVLGSDIIKIIGMEGLSKLAMESATIQKRVKLPFLKTTWRVEALLIAGAGITGGRFAFGLGLSAFQNNNVAWHNL